MQLGELEKLEKSSVTPYPQSFFQLKTGVVVH